MVDMENVTLLELEDVAKRYRHPSIIDIKLGFRTWYPTADQRYIDKCKAKDASTTQAALGFKICGMQVQLLVHFCVEQQISLYVACHCLHLQRTHLSMRTIWRVCSVHSAMQTLKEQQGKLTVPSDIV